MRLNSIIERFYSHVTVAEDGCWVFKGKHFSDNGYPRFKVFGVRRAAHRVAYALEHGDPLEGMLIDHRCRNVCCVNPDHLEAVTPAENLRRAYSRGARPCVFAGARPSANPRPAKGRRR